MSGTTGYPDTAKIWGELRESTTGSYAKQLSPFPCTSCIPFYITTGVSVDRAVPLPVWAEGYPPKDSHGNHSTSRSYRSQAISIVSSTAANHFVLRHGRVWPPQLLCLYTTSRRTCNLSACHGTPPHDMGETQHQNPRTPSVIANTTEEPSTLATGVRQRDSRYWRIVWRPFKC